MAPTPPLLARLVAEFVGTFALVAAGLGVFASGGDLLATALAHGLAIAVMVTAIGHVSGGHLNPAITLAMLVFRQVRVLDALAYVVVQLAAGVTAGLAMWVGFGTGLSALSGPTPALDQAMSPGGDMFLEAIFTLLLAWVIFGVAVDRDGAFFKVAGLPIGLTVTMGILAIGPHTGAALNPARWFGPALLSGTWSDWWVYLAGPVAGAIVGAGLYMVAVRPRIADRADVDPVMPAEA